MGFRVLTTVSTPAGSYNLTTLSAVKSDLGITDTSNDTYLTTLITRASQTINQYCNRVFVSEGMTETFYPDREYYSYQLSGGIPCLQLSRWPLISVTSVTENGTALVEGTDFLVDKENGRLLRLDTLSYPTEWPTWKTVVVYTAGYATVPGDLEEACSRLVRARYMAKTRDPFLKSERVEGVGESTYWVSTDAASGNLPPDIADAVDNYRVPVAF